MKLILRTVLALALVLGVSAIPTSNPTPTPNPISAVGEGEVCGTIVGIQCKKGLFCKLDGTYPDAAGKCKKTPYDDGYD